MQSAEQHGRVPGCRGVCLLIIQASRWKDQPAVGWLGTGPLPPRVQTRSPRLLSDVDLRIWFESSRNSKKVGGKLLLASHSPCGSCVHRVRVCLRITACVLTEREEVHASLLLDPSNPRPSNPVPRPRRHPLPCSSSSPSLFCCPGPSSSYLPSFSSSFSFARGFTRALP